MDYIDKFTGFLGGLADNYKEIKIAASSQQNASPSQYSQQMPALDNTGRPIVTPTSVQSWLMANWMVVVAILVLILVAKRMKWV